MHTLKQATNCYLKNEKKKLKTNELLSELDLSFPLKRDTQVLIACGYFDV